MRGHACALTKRYAYRHSWGLTPRSRTRRNVLSLCARDATFTDTPRHATPKCRELQGHIDFCHPKCVVSRNTTNTDTRGRAQSREKKHIHAKSRAVLEPHAKRTKRYKYRYASALFAAHQTLRLPRVMEHHPPFSSPARFFRRLSLQTLRWPTSGAPASDPGGYGPPTPPKWQKLPTL